MKRAEIKHNLKEVPKPVLEALIRGEVVPFVGAGFSRNCDGPNGFVMPDWKTLGKSVAGELVNYEYDGNPLDALSTYELQFQRINLIDLMRREFRLDAIYPGEAHKLFVECFPGLVCTTNFDTLIEDAYRLAHVNPLVITGDDALSITNQNHATIVKLHGDFNHPSRMVVTEDDYDLFIDKNPLLCTYVSNLFITRTMLLIGYSLEDNDMRQLLRIVQNRLGKMARPIYSIQVEASQNTIDRYKRRGVEVINLKRRGNKTVSEVIVDFLKRLKLYKNLISTKLVSSSKEDSKEQLLLPSDENRLCFVSCSGDRAALLREFLEPIIVRAGGVPLWSYNVVAHGVNIREAIDNAMRRSCIRIFDLSGSSKYIGDEVQVSLYTDSKKTILIRESNDKPGVPIDLSGHKVLEYSLSGEDGYYEVADVAFSKRLEEVIKDLFADAKETSLDSARHLLNMGEYSATVVAAWIALESYVRSSNDNAKGNMDFMALEKLGKSSEEDRSIFYKLKHLRNVVVHGVVSAKKDDAEFALKSAKKLLAR